MDNNIQQSILDCDTAEQEALLETTGTAVDVVKMSYECAESMEWQELFAGYSSLKAITFSSGINFVNRLLELFETAEIIFGCEAVMSYSMQEVVAFQDKLIERIRKSNSKSQDKLLSRIDSGDVKLYVARTQLSHEKIYLLSGADGKKRVIMGSANMSFNAFGGRQRENICYLDGEEAYNWYLSVFDSLKENSTDEISHKAIEYADLADNLDKLPISETVKASKVLAIEPIKDNSEDIEFILDTKKVAAELTPLVPKPDKKTGKTLVVPETILKIKRYIQDDIIKKKEQRSEYPQLVLDVFGGCVSLNGQLPGGHRQTRSGCPRHYSAQGKRPSAPA